MEATQIDKVMRSKCIKDLFLLSTHRYESIRYKENSKFCVCFVHGTFHGGFVSSWVPNCP